MILRRRSILRVELAIRLPIYAAADPTANCVVRRGLLMLEGTVMVLLSRRV